MVRPGRSSPGRPVSPALLGLVSSSLLLLGLSRASASVLLRWLLGLLGRRGCVLVGAPCLVGRCLAPPPVPWSCGCGARCPGLRHRVAVVAWHLSACRGCGRQRASLACLVAPRGAPGLVRSGRSRWSGRLSGRRGGLPHPGFTGRLRGARGGQPRTRLIVPDAGPRRGGGAGLAPRRTRAGPHNGVVPGGSLRRRSWAACAALFGLCGPGHCRVVFPIPSVVRQGTRPVHLACFVWTPKPLLLGRRTPRPGPVPVCVCVLSWAGRAGPPPGRVLVSLPFSCGPSWCSLRLLGPLRARVALLVVVDVFFVFLFFSFSSRPPCLLPFLFSGPGCPETWLFAPPPLSFFFFFFFFLPPLPFFFLPVFVFFFLLRLFFFCRGMLVMRCSVLVCPGLWGVLVCVVVGFVLRLGLLCAFNPSFGAPCLCLLPLCWCLLCCACPVAPCWRRCSSPCRLCWVPFGVACSLPPRVFCAGLFFSACRVFAGSAPPPPPACCGVLCCALSCVLSCGAAVRGVFCVVWRACVGLGSCAVLFGAVLCCVLFLLCFAVVRCYVLCLFFFCVVPCLSVVLRPVSVSVLHLCGAVLVCLRRCPLCGALLPLQRWLVCRCLVCLRVCCWAWLSSVVSWWVLVAPGVVFRWCAVLCPWVLCCAVLLRVVPPGFVLLCAVLFCFALFVAVARCVVSCGAVRRPGVLCLLVLCFVLSPRAVCVLLWCVGAWCCSLLCFVPRASWGVLLCVPCPLRPVRCCCAALLSLGALLSRAVPRGALVPCGAVVSCPAALFGLLPVFVWFLLLEKPLQILFNNKKN